MKSFVKGILFFSVTILYVVSTMGFGVHRCTSDGSASVMLLFGNAPCAYAHSHGDEGYHIHTCDADTTESHHVHGDGHNANGEDNCSGHHCADSECGGPEDHHSEDCCSTDVYVVTHDQTLTDDNNMAVPQISFDAAFANCHTLVESGDFTGYKHFFGSALGALHKSHFQASICVFRV